MSTIPITLSKLSSAISRELRLLETQVKSLTVSTYWQVGRHINESLLNDRGSSSYGENFYARLSARVDVSAATLKRAAQFYRTYPNSSTLSDLSWSHFLQLMSIKDVRTREQLANSAVKEKWNVRALKLKVDAVREKEGKRVFKSPVSANTQAVALECARGRLGIFRLIENDQNAKAGTGLFVDCGFHIRRAFTRKPGTAFQSGDIVDNKGAKVTARKNELFTYKGYLQRVVDGDTLLVLIDIGAKHFISQRLRLYRINTPELGTVKGERAKQFVINRLSPCRFLIVKTYQMDKFGRYEADVFFSARETDAERVAQTGVFLNQLLLDEGLAENSE